MDERSLIEYVTRQRWYGAKSRTVSHSEVLDTVTIRQAEPRLSLALVEMRFDISSSSRPAKRASNSTGSRRTRGSRARS
jgi:maltokinase-like protein